MRDWSSDVCSSDLLYEIILDSDLAEFGGHERISKNQRFFTQPESGQHALRLYLPARTGLILQKID